MKAIDAGRNYDLIVTPKDLTKLLTSIIRIETDCKILKHQVQQAFAVVQQ